METKNAQQIFTELSASMPCKWRLKSVTNKAKKPYPAGTRGQFLAYIDARDVFNRLDAVLGLSNWQSQVKWVNPDQSAVVSLSVRIDGGWLVREDVGYSNNPGEGVESEPLKAAVSDAVKRAAVHFGVGRFLYDLPAQWVETDPDGKPLRALNGGGDVSSIAGKSAMAPIAADRSVTNDAERSAPLAEIAPAENQPCGIEGCQGVCNGAWVNFSIRRYGTPLCGKHSALAKRGDLAAQLAAVVR
jgi:Rad52/22 family double-strand break repair protein